MAYNIEFLPSGKIVELSEDFEIISGEPPAKINNILEKFKNEIPKHMISKEMIYDNRKGEKFLHTIGKYEKELPSSKLRDDIPHSGCWDLNFEMTKDSWRPYDNGHLNLLDKYNVKKLIGKSIHYFEDTYYGDFSLGELWDRWNSNSKIRAVVAYIGYDPKRDEFYFGYEDQYAERNPFSVETISGYDIVNLEDFPEPYFDSDDGGYDSDEGCNEPDPYDDGIFGRLMKKQVTLHAK